MGISIMENLKHTYNLLTTHLTIKTQVYKTLHEKHQNTSYSLLEEKN